MGLTPQLPLQECAICVFTSDIAKINEDNGICEYCELQEKLKADAKPHLWPSIVRKMKEKGKKNQYDVVVGISGGADSSILLLKTVTEWELRPLVIHFDNRWNATQADNNIKVICDLFNVNSITYKLDKQEFDNLNKAFLWAGTPDCDIPNDIAMSKISYQVAEQYGIKYILNGHDFRNEGSTPAKWTYMDSKYMKDVYNKYTGKELVNYPLVTIWDQIKYGFLGIEHIRPFHYIEVSKGQRYEYLNFLKNHGWQDYGGKHCENIYTEWIGCDVLPNKFKIDKRRTYLSAQIRNGDIIKGQAKQMLSQPMKFDKKKIPDEYHALVAGSPVRDRKIFAHYDFKAWRPVFWILWKLGVVPRTFFKKYCN